MASVLVVEDHPDLLELFEETLSLAGHQVSGVANTAAAMGAIAKEHPAVLVLDLGIEGGVEPLVAAVGSESRIILASGAHNLPERAVAMGAAAYLRKPFGPELLVAAVERVLGPR